MASDSCGQRGISLHSWPSTLTTISMELLLPVTQERCHGLELNWVKIGRDWIFFPKLESLATALVQRLVRCRRLPAVISGSPVPSRNEIRREQLRRPPPGPVYLFITAARPLTRSSVSVAAAASPTAACCPPSGSDTDPSAPGTPPSTGPRHLSRRRGQRGRRRGGGGGGGGEEEEGLRTLRSGERSRTSLTVPTRVQSTAVTSW